MSYAARLQRFRVPLGFVMAALYLTFAPQYATPITVVVGGAIALVGLLIRAWAAGHIVKNDRLAVSGPRMTMAASGRTAATASPPRGARCG